MPLKYEPKRRLVIDDPYGDRLELFFRGNMTIGQVMNSLGFPPDHYRLTISDEPLHPGDMLKEIEDIEAQVLKVRRRPRRAEAS